MNPLDTISIVGHKTLTWKQDIGLIIIAGATVVAVGIENKVMWDNGTVALVGLLLLFIYLEILAAVFGQRLTGRWRHQADQRSDVAGQFRRRPIFNIK